MARTAILNSNGTISDYTMLRIADYMDDYLYGRVARDCKPCTNEWFIAEYARRLSLGERGIFEDTLDYAFGISLDNVVYKGYHDRYANKLISYARLIWLETACPFVLKLTELGETYQYSGSRAYVVSMISGDFVVYAREEEQ